MNNRLFSNFKRTYLAILILLSFFVIFFSLRSIVTNKLQSKLFTIGESKDWIIQCELLQNKDFVIFRPVLTSKIEDQYITEVKIAWLFDNNLNYSNANNPQINNEYMLSDGMKSEIIQLDLQHFNFINQNNKKYQVKEVSELLSKSKIKISWNSDSSESHSEEISLDVRGK